MIRKTVHLVRNTILNEEIQAIVEFSSEEIIESLEPADLWVLLTSQGVLPVADETDTGIGVFVSDLDVSKHGHLPVIDVTALNTPSPASPSVARPTPTPANAAELRQSVRKVVTLTRDFEQYEVKQAIVEAPTESAIEALDGDEFWWRHPEMEVRVGEQLPAEFAIETEDFNEDWHGDMPLVVLEGPLFPTEASPPASFLSGWEPTSKTEETDTLESERVARIVGSEPNQCYWNARKVIRALPDYAEAFYVEGFVVTHEGAIFEHGWIVKDGKIVDPTILDDTTYFPGLEFQGSDQIREFLDTEWGSRANGRPFHKAFGTGGLESPHFKEAFQQARHCLLSKFGVGAMEAAAVVRAKEGLVWPVD